MKPSSVLMSDMRREAEDMIVGILVHLEEISDRDYANCVVQLQDAVLDIILTRVDEEKITKDNYNKVSLVVKIKYAEIMLNVLEKV